MKRFVVKFLFAAAVVGAVNLSLTLLRLVWWQKEVDRAFDVPEGVRVVGVGNSHVGCSFAETPEFPVKLFWDAGMSFPFHYIRFRELERRGVFDRVKVCVVDCDTPALDYYYGEAVWKNLQWTLPFAWRYLEYVPLPRLVLIRDLLFDVHPRTTFQIAVERPWEVPNWTTWDPERKKACFRNLYGAGWQTPQDWDSPIYPPHWREHLFSLILDMKARCDRHGVRLVFLATPLASDDPGRTNPVVRDRVSAVAEKIRSMGIEYYDYRTAYPDEKMRDAGHLLLASAREFTERFLREVVDGRKPRPPR